MSNILLTVAIPTLLERKHNFTPKLEKYFSLLKLQNLENEVEIITHEDNREIPIGEKRNILLDKAKGKMISFIDDDDEITDDYFWLIVQKIKENNNLDAIQIFCTIHPTILHTFQALPKNFLSSLPNNFENKNKGRVHNSTIAHFNPIKTSLAKSIKYPNIRIHEDFCFSQKIQDKIKVVDSITHKSIYNYYYNTNISAVQEYRKPKSILLEKLNELFLDKINGLKYDSSTGEVTDLRYFKILEEFKEK
jgi:hypothetical protein